MTKIGDVFEHVQDGFRLTVCGVSWDLEKVNTNEIVAQALNMRDHDTAMQCALMCARLYVPAFYMLSAPYERFREELLEATDINEPEFRMWLRERHQDIVNGFLDTLEDKVGRFPLEDLIAHARRQYARYLGKGV